MKTPTAFLLLLTIVSSIGCNGVATKPDSDHIGLINHQPVEQRAYDNRQIDSYQLNNEPAVSYSYNTQQSALFSNAWPISDKTTPSNGSIDHRHFERSHLASQFQAPTSLEMTLPTRLSTNRETSAAQVPATQIASLGFFSDSMSASADESQSTTQQSSAQSEDNPISTKSLRRSEKTREASPVTVKQPNKTRTKGEPTGAKHTRRKAATRRIDRRRAKNRTKRSAPNVNQIVAQVIAKNKSKKNRSINKNRPRGKNDLWQRIRQGYKLPETDNLQIQTELAKYILYSSYFDRMTTNATPFLYHIVEEIEKREMPLELALLPAIESVFEPTAFSHKSAAGLWQFIPATGKEYGLTQNEWYDKRRDSIASTRAALTYLQRLHRMFDDDWLLALAAYNYGLGNVRQAIKKSLEPPAEPEETSEPEESFAEPAGELEESAEPETATVQAAKPKTALADVAEEPVTTPEEVAQEPVEPLTPDFWSLDLPKETREYVPKLLALSMIVADPEKYGIDLKTIANRPYLKRVKVGRQIDLFFTAELAEMSEAELKRLNASYIKNMTAPEGPHYVTLPIAKVALFKKRLAKIPADVTLVKTIEPEEENTQTGQTVASSNSQTEPVDNEPVNEAATHQVREGESFWIIAKQYRTTVAELRRLNPIDSPYLKVGSLLKLPATEEATEPKLVSELGKKKIVHTVKSGESLWQIAHSYQVSIDKLSQWNRLDKREFLKTGQQLTIWLDG